MEGKESRSFDRAYKKLPPKIRKNVQDRLIREVFMVRSPQTFYDKKNGKQKITDYEWLKIKEMFDEFGIDAETGELCQKIEK